MQRSVYQIDSSLQQPLPRHLPFMSLYVSSLGRKLPVNKFLNLSILDSHLPKLLLFRNGRMMTLGILSHHCVWIAFHPFTYSLKCEHPLCLHSPDCAGISCALIITGKPGVKQEDVHNTFQTIHIFILAFLFYTRPSF